MRRLSRWATAALLLVALGLWLTRPVQDDFSGLSRLPADATEGARVFNAGGCASCHSAPQSQGEARLELVGGRSFPSDFGTFYAPNISPHPEAGIGAWDLAEFANALRHGVSPQGQHYYPAFPYTTYARMSDQDVVNLWAYLNTLPPKAAPRLAHDVGFPFNIRRGLGLWKLLFFQRDWITPDSEDPQIARGRYLVEALGHCGECHTPRNALGGLELEQWLAGAPNPTGKGEIPALTPDKLNWTTEDIAYFLETGFTPEYDSAGGDMAEVVENFSQLPADHRNAVAAYLKALPGRQ